MWLLLIPLRPYVHFIGGKQQQWINIKFSTLCQKLVFQTNTMGLLSFQNMVNFWPFVNYSNRDSIYLFVNELICCKRNSFNICPRDWLQWFQRCSWPVTKEHYTNYIINWRSQPFESQRQNNRFEKLPSFNLSNQQQSQTNCGESYI